MLSAFGQAAMRLLRWSCLSRWRLLASNSADGTSQFAACSGYVEYAMPRCGQTSQILSCLSKVSVGLQHQKFINQISRRTCLLGASHFDRSRRKFKSIKKKKSKYDFLQSSVKRTRTQLYIKQSHAYLFHYFCKTLNDHDTCSCVLNGVWVG